MADDIRADVVADNARLASASRDMFDAIIEARRAFAQVIDYLENNSQHTSASYVAGASDRFRKMAQDAIWKVSP